MKPGWVHLTHWGWDKMAAISQTTFSNAFSGMKMYEVRIRFHWSLFLRLEITIFQHWFRWWLGADQATSHYLNQWWLAYWRIYVSIGLNELKARLEIWNDLYRALTSVFAQVFWDYEAWEQVTKKTWVLLWLCWVCWKFLCPISVSCVIDQTMGIVLAVNTKLNIGYTFR